MTEKNLPKHFQVVCEGELLAGFELQQAKESVAKLFRATEAQVARFFSGKLVVVKSGISDVEAKKYVTALQRCGVKSAVKTVNASGGESGGVPAKQAKNPEGEAVANKGNQSEANVMKEQKPATKTPPLKMAPVGARLGPPRRLTGKVPDTSHIEVAPVGSDLAEKTRTEEKMAPDVSHMDIAPVGTDLSPKKADVPDLDLDLSHLKLDVSDK